MHSIHTYLHMHAHTHTHSHTPHILSQSHSILFHLQPKHLSCSPYCSSLPASLTHIALTEMTNDQQTDRHAHTCALLQVWSRASYSPCSNTHNGMHCILYHSKWVNMHAYLQILMGPLQFQHVRPQSLKISLYTQRAHAYILYTVLVAIYQLCTLCHQKPSNVAVHRVVESLALSWYVCSSWLQYRVAFCSCQF